MSRPRLESAGGGDGANERERLLPVLRKLKLRRRRREKALLLDVSERALNAGDGGARSGRGKSTSGAFQ